MVIVMTTEAMMITVAGVVAVMPVMTMMAADADGESAVVTANIGKRRTGQQRGGSEEGEEGFHGRRAGLSEEEISEVGAWCNPTH